MTDGVHLATDVYVPPTIHQAIPTVLIRLPYDKCGRYTFIPEIAERFTAHGFAVVAQDVRGKFRSDGVQEPFVHEASDGSDTLDWICRQPWSNGTVGMFGDSYYGFTQWAAASTGHPALKAIVPRVTGTSFFASYHTDSVPLLPLYEWVVHTWADSLLHDEPFGVTRPQPHYFVPDESAHVREELRELVAAVSDGSFERDLFPGGIPSTNLAIPALHMSGWYDNLLDCTLLEWERSLGSPAADHQFLRIRSADHEDLHWREFGQTLPDHELGDDELHAYLDETLAEPIAFLDHYLNERGGRWLAPTVSFEVTNGTSRVSDRWPPAGSEGLTLTLADVTEATTNGGRLLGLGRHEVADVDGSSVEWLHDPEHPVPYLSASQWSQCADPPDEAPVHERANVLVFDSAPVAAPVDLVGEVSFAGVLDADTDRTHLIARLCDLYPDGRARLIAEGAAVADTSDGPATVTVPMRATAYRIRPGHAVRLALSSSLFPLYAVHPGHNGDVWDTSVLTPRTQRLLSTQGAPGRLEVGVQRA